MNPLRSRDHFSKARESGSSLRDNEAQVNAIPYRSQPFRAWVGRDHDKHAVAYFEVKPGMETSFSVSRVISVETVSIGVESVHGSLWTIKITCHDERLDEVFFVFVDELLERIHKEIDAVSVVQKAAFEWRSLLQFASSSFSESAATGLFGELKFLEQSVQAIGPKALENWQRSPHEVHDFIASGQRVEVKTSSFQNHSSVTIHGLKQLDPPLGAALTLAVAEIQKHGNDRIDDVIDRLLTLGVCRELLVEKLTAIRYVIGMPEAKEYSFDLVSWRFWEILPETAVINSSRVGTDVKNAVSSLSYSLQLASLGKPETTFDYDRFVEMKRGKE